MSFSMVNLSRASFVVLRQISQPRHMSTIIYPSNNRMEKSESTLRKTAGLASHYFYRMGWCARGFSSEPCNKKGVTSNKHTNKNKWWHSSEQGERNSRVFYNVLAGLSFAATAGSTFLAIYSAFTHVENKKKELAHEKELGLTNLIPLQERTLRKHSKFLGKAQRELRLIGNSGNRIVAKSLEGGINPIRTTIENLLEKGVDVQLIVFDPTNDKLHLSEEAIRKIEKTIKEAKEIQSQNRKGKFEVRIVNQPPPFLGDIIDKETAHIRRVPRKDPATASGIIEVYEKDSGEFNRMRDIIEDFDDIWINAKEINEETQSKLQK